MLPGHHHSVIEELLNSISHGIGAILSLVGVVVLIVLASLAAHIDPWKIIGISFYGVSLVLLYTASTLYHGIKHPRLKQLFQHLDHCAIYLLIAGTYTPFLLVNMRGPTGWTLFAIVWSLALFGIAGPGWLTDPNLALYSVALVDVWKGVGLATVIYIAGLVAIPQDYYEAARIDGATPWQITHSTLPGRVGDALLSSYWNFADPASLPAADLAALGRYPAAGGWQRVELDVPTVSQEVPA